MMVDVQAITQRGYAEDSGLTWAAFLERWNEHKTPEEAVGLIATAGRISNMGSAAHLHAVIPGYSAWDSAASIAAKYRCFLARANFFLTVADSKEEVVAMAAMRALAERDFLVEAKGSTWRDGLLANTHQALVTFFSRTPDCLLRSYYYANVESFLCKAVDKWTEVRSQRDPALAKKLGPRYGELMPLAHALAKWGCMKDFVRLSDHEDCKVLTAALEAAMPFNVEQQLLYGLASRMRKFASLPDLYQEDNRNEAASQRALTHHFLTLGGNRAD